MKKCVIIGGGAAGMIGCERLEEHEKLALDKMYIDIGANDKEDAAKSRLSRARKRFVDISRN